MSGTSIGRESDRTGTEEPLGSTQGGAVRAHLRAAWRRVRTLARRPRAVVGDGPEPASPPPGLFRCGACETVYLAREKSTCSACNEPVTRVPATLEHT